MPRVTILSGFQYRTFGQWTDGVSALDCDTMRGALLGNGITMIDVVIVLAALGFWCGSPIAVIA